MRCNLPVNRPSTTSAKTVPRPPPTDVDSIKEIMQWAEDDYAAKKKSGRFAKLRNSDSSRVEPPASVVSVLKKTTKAKKNLAPELFDRVDFSSFADQVRGRTQGIQGQRCQPGRSGRRILRRQNGCHPGTQPGLSRHLRGLYRARRPWNTPP